MRFFGPLFGKRYRSLPLGLADSRHPARRWIDAASVVADRRLDVKLVDGHPVIETNAGALGDLLGAIDLALIEAPDDPDLLTAKAAVQYLQHDTLKGNETVKRALRIAPKHVEASALRRHGRKWNSLLFLPPWFRDTQWVHSVVAEKANRGDVLHCVRHALQAALLLLLVGTQEEFSDTPVRYRWEVICSKTPYGPIGAHYVLLDMGGRIRRQEYILTPSTERSGPSDPAGPLIGRLPSVRTCFLAIAEPSGRVFHNLQYDLPPQLRSTLRELAREFAAAAGTESSTCRKAAEWHMQHFDLDSVRFPE